MVRGGTSRAPAITRSWLELTDYRLRLFSACPQNARGAVLILPGLGAASVDRPLAADDPVAMIAQQLFASGLAVVQLDRAGVGDSGGPAYGAASLDHELAGYRAALERTLREHRRVALVGLSLGGVIAPLVAAGAGAVAVWGAPSRRWSEALSLTARRQLALGGLAGDALDREAACCARFYRQLLTDDIAPAELLDRACTAARDLDGERLHGRALEFFRALERIDAAESWRRVAAPVLALSGEHDWIIAPDDAARIASWCPRGEHRVIAGLDHDMRPFAGELDSFRRRGATPVSKTAAAAIAAWIELQLAS